MIDAFNALPERLFWGIVPQEWNIVQFVGNPRNSLQIIANLPEIRIATRSQIKHE